MKFYEEVNILAFTYAKIAKIVAMFFPFQAGLKIITTTNKISILSTFKEELYDLYTTCRQQVIYWLIKSCKRDLETTQYSQYNMTNIVQNLSWAVLVAAVPEAVSD